MQRQRRAGCSGFIRSGKEIKGNFIRFGEGVIKEQIFRVVVEESKNEIRVCGL